MTHCRIAMQAARFHTRSHLSVVFGTAIAAAVFVSCLLVGDSVRESLRTFAQLRLGKICHAMVAPGRYLEASLADRMQASNRRLQLQSSAADAGRSTYATTLAPILLTNGVVVATFAEQSRQVNQVQVVGLDRRFHAFSPEPINLAPCDEDHVWLSPVLAQRLQIEPGAEISLRVMKPSLMPRDAPLSSRQGNLTARGVFSRYSILSDEQLGRFSLRADQSAPSTLFVDLAWLQKKIDLPGKANCLLASLGYDINGALRSDWQLADVGLALAERQGVLQLESERVFLDPATAEAAAKLPGSVRVLAYLVNRIAHGDKATPYSFALAAEPSGTDNLSPVPADMQDDQTIINQWLADELDVTVGETIDIAYYELGPAGSFLEATRSFEVMAVRPMATFHRERDRMPEFPGLTDVDSCDQWDVGMPMNEEQLEDPANEAYWESHRDTPKMIVTLAAGQKMWGNRFGDTSAVRFAPGEPELAENLRAQIDPRALGLSFVPVAALAHQAVEQAMGFGGLFLSLSFFLILAALLLAAMLFAFGMQRRATEMGLLLGVGWTPEQVRKLYLQEGAVIALVGSIIGALLGPQLTRGMLWGLAQPWHDAVASTPIHYHFGLGSVVVGALSAFLCAWLTMHWVLRRQTKLTPRALLTGEVLDPPLRKRRMLGPLASLSAFAAVGTAAAACTIAQQFAAYAFFGAGFLLVIAGLCACRRWLWRLSQQAGQEISLSRMGARALVRRPGRSLGTVALLASGSFLAIAVCGLQQDFARFAHLRSSGTGGFAFVGEATIPFPDPLERPAAAAAFRLEDPKLAGVSYVSVKVRAGDDASCFNLNRAQTPRLLGVPVAALKQRGAFAKAPHAPPWTLLDQELGPKIVPGLVGDANTAMWTLGKKVGDQLSYQDERGNWFQVQIVGTLPQPLSILQGSVLISQAAFTERFPSEPGYRMLLVDAPAEERDAACQLLAKRFERIGLDLEPAAARLKRFHSVEAAYLTIFLVLGGLGVVLGTFGLGAIVLRNMLERRHELAAMRAFGYSPAMLQKIVLHEHILLLLWGVGLGGISALIAILPALLSPHSQVPVAIMGALIATILTVGICSTWLATHSVLAGTIRESLQCES